VHGGEEIRGSTRTTRVSSARPLFSYLDDGPLSADPKRQLTRCRPRPPSAPQPSATPAASSVLLTDLLSLARAHHDDIVASTNASPPFRLDHAQRSRRLRRELCERGPSGPFGSRTRSLGAGLGLSRQHLSSLLKNRGRTVKPARVISGDKREYARW